MKNAHPDSESADLLKSVLDALGSAIELLRSAESDLTWYRK